MENHLPDAKYLERAKETYKFHRSKLVLDNGWNISKTAKALRRSIGSISEDLMIIKFYKDHEKELDKFDYAYEALEYIRKAQRAGELEGID
jgi:hypothetical protein